MQIIVLLGKSCGGKTILQKKLAKFGFTPVISYTTRPPRQGERNGVRYHFIPDRKFYQLFLAGFFVGTTSVKTHHGDVWRYGFAMDDIAEDSVVIGNSRNIGALRALQYAKPMVFYIDTSENVIYECLKAQNYSMDEIQRRMVKSRGEFEHMSDFMDYRIVNNGLVGMDELVQQIYEVYRRHIV